MYACIHTHVRTNQETKDKKTRYMKKMTQKLAYVAPAALTYDMRSQGCFMIASKTGSSILFGNQSVTVQDFENGFDGDGYGDLTF